jgi:hypothetical protein
VHAEEFGADKSAPLAARERERERGRGLAPTGGVHLSGVAGVGGGPTGLVWTEKRFSIFLEFLMSFLFYFP